MPATTRRAPRRARRPLLIAAALAAVAVAAAVGVSASQSPDTKPAPARSALFDGIPERDGVLGDPAAPVTVTEYLDLQCPVCAASARETLPALIRDRVRTGQVKLAARTLHFLGPDSVSAAHAAAAAQEEGRLWPFLHAFLTAQGAENSGYVTDEFLRGVADAAGVDERAVVEYDGQEQLNRANADAQRLGVDATPTFAVQRGDGEPVVVAGHDPAALDAAIERALAR